MHLPIYMITIAKYAIGLAILFFGLSFTGVQVPTIINDTAHVVAKIIDPKQITCMAKNIFYEAGAESTLGQAAVARVVMNRVAHGFGKNPCQVIYQINMIERPTDEGEIAKFRLCQFSWVCEDKPEPSKTNPAYIQANQVAYDVLVNDAYKEVVPKSTLFFHNIYVDPMWPYKQVIKIGNHVFYSKSTKQSDTKK